MDIKALVADQMGHFTPYDIGTTLVSLLAAALLSFAVGLLAKATSPSKKEMAVMAALVAFAVCFVRASVPLSIALVAVVLLLRGETRDANARGFSLRLAALAIGVGCGSSASVIVAALALPLGLLLRWATSEKG